MSDITDERIAVAKMAEVLRGAWNKAEPDHAVTRYPQSYISTFCDMARAVLALQPSASAVPEMMRFKFGDLTVQSNIPRSPPTAAREQEGDDGEPIKLCTVCGSPVRYGSRHSQCGAAIMRAKASATGAEPAAWQERQQTDYFDGWSDWYDTNSTKVVGKTEAFEVKSSGVRYQFRPLYATPTPRLIPAQTVIPSADEWCAIHGWRTRDWVEGWDAARSALATPTTVQAEEPVDVEKMLRDCVPGGSSCDPQTIADDIRGWFAGKAPDVARVRAEALAEAADRCAAQSKRWKDERAIYVATECAAAIRSLILEAVCCRRAAKRGCE